jgi:hypothetical protein
LRDRCGKFPVDYKFHVFYGKCNYITVIYERFVDKNIARYTSDWKYINVKGSIKQAEHKEKPENLQLMIDLAQKLGKPFDFIRVDLYLLDKHIYFGEFTNYPLSGSEPLPESFDFLIGAKWKEFA